MEPSPEQIQELRKQGYGLGICKTCGIYPVHWYSRNWCERCCREAIRRDKLRELNFHKRGEAHYLPFDESELRKARNQYETWVWDEKKRSYVLVRDSRCKDLWHLWNVYTQTEKAIDAWIDTRLALDEMNMEIRRLDCEKGQGNPRNRKYD